MKKWLADLKYDPIAPLLQSGDDAVSSFVQRDLLGQDVALQDLWKLPEAQRILRKQNPNGSWTYPQIKKHVRTQENYGQIETYRNLGILIEEFGLNADHPAIQKAAEHLFSFQSGEGDFRGVYGNQYSPNYSAGITELLVKAGYENDGRIKKMFEWLLEIRQEDGGWAIPFRTRSFGIDVISNHTETIKPDASKPFSHMVTAVVLRAFAAHPIHRKSKSARHAGELLLSSLFKKDHYPDRNTPEYWLKFSFPFWYTDLISAMDSLSLLGFSKHESRMQKALQWFVAHQQSDGLWKLKLLKGRDKDLLQLWLSFAICRIFKRLSS